MSNSQNPQSAISLKESFRILNILDQHTSSLLSYISNKSNSLKVEEIHLKSKVTENQDETIDQTTERQYKCSVTNISFLISQLISQKLELSLAIENAKKDLFLDWQENGENLTLDTGILFAKKSRELSNNLKYLLDLKPSEAKSFGSDFIFNIEGNQVQYKFPIEKKVTLDFDRNEINTLYKFMLNRSNTLSIQIEKAMMQDIVEFIPIYDILASTSEIVEEYLSNN